MNESSRRSTFNDSRLSFNDSVRLANDGSIKVCIIGAGISGLSVAYHLLKHNNRTRSAGGDGPLFEVQILEARDRIGGRIYPCNIANEGSEEIYVDLGAQWIHEAGPENPLLKLLEDIKVDLLYAKRGINDEDPATYSMIDVPSGTYASNGTLIPNQIYRAARTFYTKSRVCTQENIDPGLSYQDLLDQAHQAVVQKAESLANGQGTRTYDSTDDDDDDETETDEDEEDDETETDEEEEGEDDDEEEEEDDDVSVSVVSDPLFVQAVHCFRHSTECYEGGRLDEISVALRSNYHEIDGSDDIPEGGFHAVLKKLERYLGRAGNCSLRLNVPVQAIHYLPNKEDTDEEKDDVDDDDLDLGVQIDYKHGNNILSVNADCCVCTVPLGVLQKRGIEFNPPLPQAVQESVDKIGMGVLDKIMLLFETQFWDEDWHGNVANEDPTRLQTFMDVSEDYNGQPILAMLLGGDVARRFDNAKYTLSDEDILKEAMKTLKMLFGDHIPHPIGFKVSRWLQDPYAYGSYSFHKVGSSKEDYDRVSAPGGKNLFFAGEHTSKHHHSTVHGAWESGQREAERIIDEADKFMVPVLGVGSGRIPL